MSPEDLGSGKKLKYGAVAAAAALAATEAVAIATPDESLFADASVSEAIEHQEEAASGTPVTVTLDGATTKYVIPDGDAKETVD